MGIVVTIKPTFKQVEKRVLDLMTTNLVPRAYAQRGLKGAALWFYKNSLITMSEYGTIMKGGN